MLETYIGTTGYGRHWLDAPAAESWFRCVRDGCPDDGITDAGRTQQEQITVFLKYFTTDFSSSAKFDPRGWNGRTYWRRKGMPSAATPGSPQARHTFGRALDLNNLGGQTKAWMRANGYRYGWIKDLVAGEDWHFEYQPARDVVLVSNPGTGTGTVPTVPTIPTIDPLEDDMTPDQDRILREVHRALGAGGASTLTDGETVLGVVKTIRGNTTGVPEVLRAARQEIAAVAADVESTATKVNETAGVLWEGTGGTPQPSTIYPTLHRVATKVGA